MNQCNDKMQITNSIDNTYEAITTINMIPTESMSGVGVSLSKTRPTATSIHGSNKSSNPINWFMSFNKDKRYMVDANNPIEAIFLDEKDRNEVRPSNEHLFKRRIDAEIYILVLMREKYLFDCDNEMVGYYQNKIDTIEEEYPEWTV